jgi:hypothetical protein
MKVARFRFDDNLRPLLRRDKAAGEFDYAFNGPQSAKHLIESVDIPHTEFGKLMANGMPVGPSYLVQHGDTMDVFGIVPDPEPPTEPRFVLDGHLGRLNAHLRMLGLDCLYENDTADNSLLRISVNEDRILLTRDRRLLMQKSIKLGYLVRSVEPWQQLREVFDRYGLRTWVRPFQRCIRCNHLLEAVRKEEIQERLEPLTKLYFEEFRICPACKQIYWKGSHFDMMQRLIASLD